MVNCKLEILRDFPQITHFVVAFSGGLDSTVLLHILSQENINLKAIHINHNLSPHAAAWEVQCKNFCEQLRVEYHSYSITIDKNNGESIEAQAREKRYAILAEHIGKQTMLLTAHHADDQAETVLLQLMRGSGVAGLAAMPAIRPFAQGWLYRPLLTNMRAELETYATQHQLAWITDESNFDVSYERNFIRHQLLPMMQKRWPAVKTLLNRTAQHAFEAESILSQIAEQDLEAIAISANQIDIHQLKQLTIERQHNVLRFWLKAYAQVIPEQKQLQEIFSNVIDSRHDAEPCITFDNWQIRRHSQTLYLLQLSNEQIEPFSITWDLKTDLVLPKDLGILKVEDYKAFINDAPLTICNRQPGLKVLIEGRQGHHKLKHLFQEWGVPVWERDRVVLILAGDKVLATVT